MDASIGIKMALVLAIILFFSINSMACYHSMINYDNNCRKFSRRILKSRWKVLNDMFFWNSSHPNDKRYTNLVHYGSVALFVIIPLILLVYFL